MNTIPGKYPAPDSYLSDDLLSLNRTTTNFFTLSTRGLAELRRLINFTQIRVYCRKPSIQRIVHIATSLSPAGQAVVDYMTGQTDKRPASCNSYTVLSEDTSTISRKCGSWFEGAWGAKQDGSIFNARLYETTAYIFGTLHILPGYRGSRYECDDYQTPSKTGIWMYFVR